jgi:glycosyltransferase involved in cell wall biosynthesis
VHPAFAAAPDADADAFIDAALGGRSGPIDLLHVGTCIARKRIDRLLNIVAAVRRVEPRVRLLKAGGSFTPEQVEQARRLGLTDAIVTLPFLPPGQLAALYRRAHAVVLTSEREGFGLPVVEALACGTAVIAADIPVFREVGGIAAEYCDPDDLDAWRDTVLRVAGEDSRGAHVRRGTARLHQASRFTWHAYADAMATTYRRVLLEGGRSAAVGTHRATAAYP